MSANITPALARRLAAQALAPKAAPTEARTCPTCSTALPLGEWFDLPTQSRRGVWDCPTCLVPVAAERPVAAAPAGPTVRALRKRKPRAAAPGPVTAPARALTRSRRMALEQLGEHDAGIYWTLAPLPQRGSPPCPIAAERIGMALLPTDRVRTYGEALTLRMGKALHVAEFSPIRRFAGRERDAYLAGVARALHAEPERENLLDHRREERWQHDLAPPSGPVRVPQQAARRLSHASKNPGRACAADGTTLRGVWREGDRQQQHKAQASAHRKERAKAAFVARMAQGKVDADAGRRRPATRERLRALAARFGGKS